MTSKFVFTTLCKNQFSLLVAITPPLSLKGLTLFVDHIKIVNIQTPKRISVKIMPCPFHNEINGNLFMPISKAISSASENEMRKAQNQSHNNTKIKLTKHFYLKYKKNCITISTANTAKLPQ